MRILRFFYNSLVTLSWCVLQVIALYKPKIKKFVSGRKTTFRQLKQRIPADAKVIWMHVASLGEYEQGLPVLEKLRTNYPQYTLLVTFFSPSGYEARKNNALADVVTYLPVDTLSNVRQFLAIVKPELALFVKYEIWPNYLFELRKRKVPTLLLSAFFLKRHIFFKPLGGFMRKSLQGFSHFFVQDQSSKDLLASIGVTKVTVSGDTRFDRVSEILKRDNHLPFMENFKGDHFCFVAGSTWPEDEEILADYINTSTRSLKYVIVPRRATMKSANMDKLKRAFKKKTICFSAMEGKDISQYEVILVDTFGPLSKIYNYADVAYVGGAFATGLHNTLEPGVYGIPVIIGPEYDRFKEAKDLVQKKGIHVVNNLEEFKTVMERFINDPDFREKTGAINATYVKENTGATDLILSHITQLL